MSTATHPIAVTSILSVVLHGMAVAALLILYDQMMPDNAVGQGVEIELISSVKVSNQHETEVLRKRQLVQKQVVERQVVKQQVVAQAIANKTIVKRQDKKKSTGSTPVLVSLSTVKSPIIVNPTVTNSAVKHFTVRNSKVRNSSVESDAGEQQEQKQQHQIVPEENSITTVAQSTAASQQQHSILELLHSRIADNKKYPYLAKRQRREGVTTVAFVLHPSGMIEDMQLINSSQTTALDRAALSAVKGIVPFTLAKDYLKQAETFRVDVVFKLL